MSKPRKEQCPYLKGEDGLYFCRVTHDSAKLRGYVQCPADPQSRNRCADLAGARELSPRGQLDEPRHSG